MRMPISRLYSTKNQRRIAVPFGPISKIEAKRSLKIISAFILALLSLSICQYAYEKTGGSPFVIITVAIGVMALLGGFIAALYIFSWLQRQGASAPASEENLKNLVDHLDRAIVWEMDSKTMNFSFVSNQCEELLGYSRNDWVSFSSTLWQSIVPDEDQEKLSISIRSVQSGISKSDRCDHRFITKVGQMRWFRTCFHIHNSDQDQARIYGISFEITDIKETQFRLSQGQIEFKASFDLAATGMAQCDPQTGQFLRVNAKLCDYLGYLPEELFKMSILDLIHPEDRLKDFHLYLEMVAGKRPVYTTQKRYVKKDGTLLWTGITAAVVLRDCADRPLKTLVTVHDLNDLKRTEEEIRKAHEAAEMANQAKTSFLANMSHEIRTPIGVIQGYAELLNESNELSPDSQDMIKSIIRNTHQLTEIIGEILDVSKIEADKVEIEFLRFPLHELIDDVNSVLSFKALQKGIEFQFKMDVNPPKYLVTDPTRLKQILLNLGGNAIKFTQNGFVQIRFQCLDKNLETDSCDSFRFIVRDTGIGISCEAQKKLFSPFSQADASTTRRFGGTGLGLFISRNLTKALGGTLELTHSVPGEGSCFTLTFAKSHPHHVKDHPSVSRYKLQKPKGRLESTKILLVEDSKDNQLLLTKLLSREGAEVQIASNGREGYEKALSDDYSLVLMDIQMPEFDGWESVRYLRSHDYKKPIVALTAHAFREERERSFEAGFSDYLTKPVDREFMIHTILNLTQEAHT